MRRYDLHVAQARVRCSAFPHLLCANTIITTYLLAWFVHNCWCKFAAALSNSRNLWIFYIWIRIQNTFGWLDLFLDLNSINRWINKCFGLELKQRRINMVLNRIQNTFRWIGLFDSTLHKRWISCFWTRAQNRWKTCFCRIRIHTTHLSNCTLFKEPKAT